ncbi:MAG: NADH-quinone oxidoreductase subunit L [Anaerolineaceae bacterium]|jgi:NADH-quinone oxidoreductase subunit L|nr:NADH-quinone oxidoreductase subunit L [Anaerolineaceae bacterium]
MNYELITWLIPIPPLLAFFVIFLATYKNNRLSHTLAIGSAALSWLLSMIIFLAAVINPKMIEKGIISSISWLPTAQTWLKIGIQVDALTVITLFFVSWTILMIFIYSVGYHNFGQPEGDHDRPGLPPHGAAIIDQDGKHQHVPSIEPMYARFFGFFGLFAFGMYLLVVSNNLLTLYIGWEIMGLCSYLLIGFWYAKPSARAAGQKAFLTTRIGDVFMLIGLVALYTITGSLQYDVIFSEDVLHNLATSISPVMGLSWAGLIGLLVFFGVVGKSSQFPLHIWLPDAMEGPTPVSAMIHAATMVSAGVYLAIRFFPVLSAGWDGGSVLTIPMLVMAIIGSFTALFSATIAVAQKDVKRVLAYSTISQLGFMIAALGVGAYIAAAFHLVTHAIFKALLFLGSGSIIHGMEHGVLHTQEHIDPQDMFNMGGLYKKMPKTFATFVIGGFALAGFPFVTAGFWSKDEILSGAFNGGFDIVFWVLAIAAFLTAFYTMRQISLVFLGKARTEAARHALETPHTMTIPLFVLAFFAITIGWVGIPEFFPVIGGLVPNWLESFLGMMLHGEHAPAAHHSSIPLITSLVVSLGGLFLGGLLYRNIKATEKDPLEWSLSGFYKVLANKYYIDEIYQFIFIRPATWVAEKVVYQIFDQKIFDGFLHGVGKISIWLGDKFRYWFDLPVINKGGDNMALGARKIGTNLKVTQSGRIQDYMVLALAFSLLGGFIFYLILF